MLHVFYFTQNVTEIPKMHYETTDLNTVMILGYDVLVTILQNFFLFFF